MPRAARGERRRTKTQETAFGAILREIRTSRSISQEALSFEGGFHRTYIGQLERGEKSPSLRTLFKLARALGVRPSELVRRTEESL